MSLVTIILTTLNSANLISRSVESCLEQTHRELELLVVDGGSQDQTLEIIADYNDPRIRLIQQKDNAGKLPGAINLGMANARGGFITWTQDDCWYEPDAIEVMLSFLEENPGVDLVYTDYWEVDDSGKRLCYQSVNIPDNVLVDDVVRVCFLFRRKVYEVIGPQDVKYFPVHEVPWRIRVAHQFQIYPLHIPLFNYVVNPNSLTGQIGNYRLRQMTAQALFAEGYLVERDYRRRLAEIEIESAYEEYSNGNYSGFFKYALSGIWRDWHSLKNLGLLKLMLKSLTPRRDKYRQEWKEEWAEKKWGTHVIEG